MRRSSVQAWPGPQNNKIMKVDINITEGCTCFSYTINGKEWTLLTDPNSEDYDIGFVNAVCSKLIEEVKKQYGLPEWILGYLYDGDYEAECTQQMFITLVQNNKNVKEKWLGDCDECGDSIYEWKLVVDI